jgi:hypothetical protein
MLVQLDYDLVDYVSQLREGILEAYTGIVTGFKGTQKGTYKKACPTCNPSLIEFCSLPAPATRSVDIGTHSTMPRG